MAVAGAGPVGLVLKESGVKLPTIHRVDPIGAIRSIRYARRMIPVLRWREKRLRKRLAAALAVDSRMEVY